jgi:F-type H+-transporting ATPase subunit delta
MQTSRALARQIVATYASVLFDAAAASDNVDDVSTQLDAVVRLVRSHAPLRDALRDDSVAGAQRAQMLREVLTGLHPALVDTLAVMVERDNFDLLNSVVEEYGNVSEERRGIVAVDVTTAVELTDALRQTISAKLSVDLGKGVSLREKVDPSIIGGIVISTHGHRIDASVSSQLEAARVVLSTAPTGGEA